MVKYTIETQNSKFETLEILESFETEISINLIKERVKNFLKQRYIYSYYCIGVFKTTTKNGKITKKCIHQELYK